jgi:hypothetical protein
LGGFGQCAHGIAAVGGLLLALAGDRLIARTQNGLTDRYHCHQQDDRSRDHGHAKTPIPSEPRRLIGYRRLVQHASHRVAGIEPQRFRDGSHEAPNETIHDIVELAGFESLDRPKRDASQLCETFRRDAPQAALLREVAPNRDPLRLDRVRPSTLRFGLWRIGSWSA